LHAKVPARGAVLRRLLSVMSGSRSVGDLIGLRARFLSDEGGATSIEYAIIAGGLSIVIIVAVTSIGTTLNTTFTTLSTKLK